MVYLLNRNCVIILCTLLSLTSCESNNIEDVLMNDISDQFSKEKCNISIKSTFDFKWDTLYILDGLMYPDEISEAIQIPYSGAVLQDGRGRLIFIRNKTVIKEVDRRFSRLHFVGMRSKERNYVKLDKDDVFCAEKKNINSTPHFYLRRN